MPYTYYIEDRNYSGYEVQLKLLAYNLNDELLRTFTIALFIDFSIIGAVTACIPTIPIPIVGRLLLISPLPILSSYIIDLSYDPSPSQQFTGTYSGIELVNAINELNKLNGWSNTYFQDKSEIYKKFEQHEYASQEPLTLDDFNYYDFPKHNRPGAVLAIHKADLTLAPSIPIESHNEALVQEIDAPSGVV
jgi:hypothetical protein